MLSVHASNKKATTWRPEKAEVFQNWPESSYHPIHNNCTTFAEELLDMTAAGFFYCSGSPHGHGAEHGMTHETKLSVGKIAISEKNGKSEQFDSRDESFCGRLLKNFDCSTQKYSVVGREMKPRHYSHFTRECFPYKAAKNMGS